MTYIHQSTHADGMKWSIGELIVMASEKEIHTLQRLEEPVLPNPNKGGAALLECRNG